VLGAGRAVDVDAVVCRVKQGAGGQADEVVKVQVGEQQDHGSVGPGGEAAQAAAGVKDDVGRFRLDDDAGGVATVALLVGLEGGGGAAYAKKGDVHV